MTRPLLLLATLLALLLAGCGEKDEPSAAAGGGELEPFTVMLDYFPNADHAALYAALGSGEYERAGLDVKLMPPPDPSAPLRLLEAGRADVAISYPPELLLARDKGTDVVSVGALVQKPLTSIITLDRRIKSPRDLAGKRVGTAGISYQSAYLKTILEHAGVDPESVREINVGFNLTPAMLSRRVDATLGSFWNYEGVDLRRRGRHPTIMRMEQLGVPTYPELIFAARPKDLDEDGASRLRRFLQATARGVRMLREDPALGVDALLDADDGLDRGLQMAVVRATLPVFMPSDPDQPFGYQDERGWVRYAQWMYENGLVERDPNAQRPLTNEFLPGQAFETEPRPDNLVAPPLD